jgi:hypothetical protein
MFMTEWHRVQVAPCAGGAVCTWRRVQMAPCAGDAVCTWHRVQMAPCAGGTVCSRSEETGRLRQVKGAIAHVSSTSRQKLVLFRLLIQWESWAHSVAWGRERDRQLAKPLRPLRHVSIAMCRTTRTSYCVLFDRAQ